MKFRSGISGTEFFILYRYFKLAQGLNALNSIIGKLLVFAVMLSLIQTAYSQENYRKAKTNLENINVLLDASFELLEDRLILNKDKVYLLEFINYKDAGNETETYFRSRIKSKFPNYKIISDVNLGHDAKIVIDSLKIDTKYLKLFEKDLLGDKYVKRDVVVSYRCSFRDSEVEGYRFRQSFSDDFELDRLNMIESNNFLFGQGVLPPQSFFSKYLIPSVVVLASAVAVILFFTVRNK